MVEVVAAGIISLAVILLFVALVVVVADTRGRGGGSSGRSTVQASTQVYGGSTQTLPPPPPPPPPPLPLPSPRLTFGYHTGPLPSIIDMYRNSRVKLGASRPAGLWMWDSFANAQDYARLNSNLKMWGIIELRISPYKELESMGGGIYLAEIPNGVTGKYYKFPDIQAWRVLSVQGRQIAP